MTLLSTDQMAEFVARGVIRLDAVVPADVNAQALEDFPRMFRGWLEVAKAAIARAPQGELGSEPALVPTNVFAEPAVLLLPEFDPIMTLKSPVVFN